MSTHTYIHIYIHTQAWFKLNTNTNPKSYVLLDKGTMITALSSNDFKKREKGLELWTEKLHAIQKGLYLSCQAQMYQQKIRDIQMGIKGKLGELDSYERKSKVKALFDEIDTDGSGEVDALELQEAFKSLDVNMPLVQVLQPVLSFLFSLENICLLWHSSVYLFIFEIRYCHVFYALCYTEEHSCAWAQ
jgi:hypothetical protein